jgi:hypothetical protein
MRLRLSHRRKIQKNHEEKFLITQNNNKKKQIEIKAIRTKFDIKTK